MVNQTGGSGIYMDSAKRQIQQSSIEKIKAPWETNICASSPGGILSAGDPSFQESKKNTSQGAAAAEDGKNSTTSADEGKLSGSSKAEADKTKDPQLLKGAVGEENAAKPVRVEFFEAKRFDHWPRTEGLSHKRIQSTLDFLEYRKRNGVVPGLDVLIPYHVNDAVIMTLQRLSQANPREWKNTCSQNPEELLRILLAAFPLQGLQKVRNELE